MMRPSQILARISEAIQPSRGIMHAPIPRIAGVRLSMETAFAVSAVFACVTVIAKSLAGNRCHWEVVEQRANGDLIYRRNTSAWWLLNYQPNPEQTPKAFKDSMLITAALWGDGIAEIERDIVGRPLWLWPLEPEKTRIDRDAGGNKIALWENRVIPWNNVLCFQGPSDGFRGYNTIALAAVTIAQILAAEQFNLKFYEHGTSMGGVVSSDQDLAQEDLDDLRKQIEDRIAGAEQAFRLLILGNGLKFTPTNQTQKDGMVLDTRYFLIEEICRYYGMPPHKIAHLLRSTNNNIEHQGLEFTIDTLTPWATAAEEECTLKLFPNRSMMRVQIDTDELAEGDALSRAQVDSTLVNSGLRNRNELRQKRGWNNMGPDGDKYTVQANMTTIDKLGNGVIDASKQLFTNALKRVVKRQMNRAASIMKQGMTAAEFRQKFGERAADDVAYARQLFAETVAVLRKIDLDVDSAGMWNVMERCVRENVDRIADIFTTGVDKYDVDERADTVADQLMPLIKTVKEITA